MNSNALQRAIQDSSLFQPTDQCGKNCRRNANFNQWLHDIYTDKSKHRESEGHFLPAEERPMTNGLRPTFDSELRRTCTMRARRAESFPNVDKHRVPQFSNDYPATERVDSPLYQPIYDRTAINRLSQYDSSESLYSTASTDSSDSLSTVVNVITPTKSMGRLDLKHWSTKEEQKTPTKESKQCAKLSDGPSSHRIIPLSVFDHNDLQQSLPVDSNDYITQANTLFNSTMEEADTLGILKRKTTVNSDNKNGLAFANVELPVGEPSQNDTWNLKHSKNRNMSLDQRLPICDGQSHYLLKRIVSDNLANNPTTNNTKEPLFSKRLMERIKTWQSILDGDPKQGKPASPKKTTKDNFIADNESKPVSPCQGGDRDLSDDPDHIKNTEKVLSVVNVNCFPGSSDHILQERRKLTKGTLYDDLHDMFMEDFYDDLPDLIDLPEDVQDFLAPVEETILDVFTSAHGIVVCMQLYIKYVL